MKRLISVLALVFALTAIIASSFAFSASAAGHPSHVAAVPCCE
jgi:hypothetical protein